MNQWVWVMDGWVVLVGVLSACSCALLGNFLVLRKMSLMGDAISHAVLPGLAIAFLISQSRASLPMFFGAVIVGALTALLTQTVSRFGKVEEGAAMGVVFSILFAVGLILIRHAADHVDLDPGCVLYGNIENVPFDALADGVPQVVWTLGAVLILNLLFVGLLYKELKISAFDPALATSLGINANLMHYALMIMVAITTVANFEAVGSILVIAMLIVPAAAAHLLTDRLGHMIVLSLLIGAVSAVASRLIVVFGPSFIGAYADTNTAALSAVLSGLILVAALFAAPRHGLISQFVRRLALRLQIIREDILGLLYRWHERNRERASSIGRSDLLKAVGDTRLTRRALRSLVRNGLIEPCTSADPTGEMLYTLCPRGIETASQLVRSHRLWESYLDKHFELPLDHLHEPAERLEHYISPDLRDRLDQDLTRPGHDPHGRTIPQQPPEPRPSEPRP